MKKTLFYFSLFLTLLNCHACVPKNQILVTVLSGQYSSIYLSLYSYNYLIDEEAASMHTGAGSTKTFLCDICIVFQSNSATIPHTAVLSCETYEDGAFFAINNTAKHKIAIYKNFDLTGSLCTFTLIEPTSSTTVLKSSSTDIDSRHELHFYMAQHEYNSFYGGDYVSVFTFLFTVP